ncbi:Uma2 family endonuclease [Streptomycetaceae bacterium NBC_01309]
MVERGINIPELLDGISAPDGWRVEFVEGEITVSPLPGGPHNVLGGAIQEEFTWHFRRLGLSYQARMCFGFCSTASCSDTQKGDHVIPDVAVMTRPLTSAELKACGHGWVSRAALDLVVEVTSSNRTADTVAKVKVYGRMAIPHYLLVDRRDRVTTLSTEPTGDIFDPGYAAKQVFAFGDDITLPDPYPILETEAW